MPEPEAAPPVVHDDPAGGGASVQLGALNSSDAAMRAWHNISGGEPALFNGKSPEVEPVTLSGKTFYRLRVGGFASRADAAKFCGEVSAAGNACTLADF
jgi:cell division septation protein DedD